MISGEFNTKDVPNTLWVSVTMGRKPGQRLIGLLEGRTEVISGEFNPKDIANTVWVYSTMGKNSSSIRVTYVTRVFYR